jgi:hypothetical protein
MVEMKIVLVSEVVSMVGAVEECLPVGAVEDAWQEWNHVGAISLEMLADEMFSQQQAAEVVAIDGMQEEVAEEEEEEDLAWMVALARQKSNRLLLVLGAALWMAEDSPCCKGTVDATLDIPVASWAAQTWRTAVVSEGVAGGKAGQVQDPKGKSMRVARAGMTGLKNSATETIECRQKLVVEESERSRRKKDLEPPASSRQRMETIGSQNWARGDMAELAGMVEGQERDVACHQKM